MNTSKLTGLVAATHTPFTAAGTLNLATVEKQAAHLLRHGLNTVFIAGSTGESHSLNVDERRQLAQRWMEVTRGTAMQVVVHVGTNCLVDAQTLATHAQESGALAVAALAPCYFKPATVEVLVQWCAEIAGAAPELPFYFYDIPVLTGVSLPMTEFLEKAALRIPNLAGIKFTNANLDLYRRCGAVDHGRFDLAWGIDEQLIDALAAGAQAAVGSSYNFAPGLYQRLWKSFEAGNLEEARADQKRAVELIELIASTGYLGTAKAMMKMLGVDVGPARLPNINPTTEQVAALHAELERRGLWEGITR